MLYCPVLGGALVSSMRRRLYAMAPASVSLPIGSLRIRHVAYSCLCSGVADLRERHRGEFRGIPLLRRS
jgi:hypothetical protein